MPDGASTADTWKYGTDARTAAISTLFQPVAAVPPEPQRPITPELLLYCAILEDALHCATNPKTTARRVALEAVNWLLAGETDPCGSRTLCEMFNIDYQAMVERLIMGQLPHKRIVHNVGGSRHQMHDNERWKQYA